MPHTCSWNQISESRKKGFLMDDVTVKYGCDCGGRMVKGYAVFEGRVLAILLFLMIAMGVLTVITGYLLLLRSIR
jgi:hypothetical protein